MPGQHATARIQTPLGWLLLSADDAQLTGVRIGVAASEAPAPDHRLLREAAAQFQAWFAGRLTEFDLPLAPAPGDDGPKLRAGIAAIPYGETRTYGDVGNAVGAIARAVGQACKTNAFPIIIPCHRVVSAGGQAFYSGGDGPRTKGWLLDFESSNLPPNQRNRLL